MKLSSSPFVAIAFILQTIAASADCTLSRSITVPPNPATETKSKHAYGLADGSQVFLGQLFVDADGAPKAYHKNDAVALDTLDNAGVVGNWWALATTAKDCGPAGTPVVQGANDPAPGYYVVLTSMVNPAIASCRSQRKYVDAQKIPYVALSPLIRKFNYNANKGALALVVNLKTGKRAYGVFADQAPQYGFGEASIYLNKLVGNNPSPKTGGTDVRQNVIVVFNASMGFPKDAAAVATAGAAAFAKWGGEARLKDCTTKVKAAPR